MKSTKKSFAGVLSLAVFVLVFVISSTLSARDYYQIKVYNVKDQAQQATVENYLKDAWLPALHKAGVKKIGVFKPIANDPAAGKKIFVFIPLKNLGQIEKIEAALAKDSEYQKAGTAYINAAFDNPPYVRMESLLLKAFSEMPKFSVPKYTTPKCEQIFELRSYEGATEKIWKKKVEMFNEGGEVALFKKLEFNAVFYGEVISGSAMPNLIYMTSFSDIKSNQDHWNVFRDHPDWKKLSGMKEYKNTVSHMDKYLMHPTDYSDI